jgi:hypothetical protein
MKLSRYIALPIVFAAVVCIGCSSAGGNHSASAQPLKPVTLPLSLDRSGKPEMLASGTKIYRLDSLEVLYDDTVAGKTVHHTESYPNVGITVSKTAKEVILTSANGAVHEFPASAIVKINPNGSHLLYQWPDMIAPAAIAGRRLIISYHRRRG